MFLRRESTSSQHQYDSRLSKSVKCTCLLHNQKTPSSHIILCDTSNEVIWSLETTGHGIYIYKNTSACSFFHDWYIMTLLQVTICISIKHFQLIHGLNIQKIGIIHWNDDCTIGVKVPRKMWFDSATMSTLDLITKIIYYGKTSKTS